MKIETEMIVGTPVCGVRKYTFDGWANQVAGIPCVDKWVCRATFPHPTNPLTSTSDLNATIEQAIIALRRSYPGIPTNATFTRIREQTKISDNWVVTMTVIQDS